MNSNDVNSIINNLCDKLGTTASKLIPEMAGYQIAKHSIWYMQLHACNATGEMLGGDIYVQPRRNDSQVR